jgi:hypothetical protein
MSSCASFKPPSGLKRFRRKGSDTALCQAIETTLDGHMEQCGGTAVYPLPFSAASVYCMGHYERFFETLGRPLDAYSGLDEAAERPTLHLQPYTDQGERRCQMTNTSLCGVKFQCLNKAKGLGSKPLYCKGFHADDGTHRDPFDDSEDETPSTRNESSKKTHSSRLLTDSARSSSSRQTSHSTRRTSSRPDNSALSTGSRSYNQRHSTQTPRSGSSGRDEGSSRHTTHQGSTSRSRDVYGYGAPSRYQSRDAYS